MKDGSTYRAARRNALRKLPRAERKRLRRERDDKLAAEALPRSLHAQKIEMIETRLRLGRRRAEEKALAKRVAAWRPAVEGSSS